jgi:hypothetical protein
MYSVLFLERVYALLPALDEFVSVPGNLQLLDGQDGDAIKVIIAGLQQSERLLLPARLLLTRIFRWMELLSNRHYPTLDMVMPMIDDVTSEAVQLSDSANTKLEVVGDAIFDVLDKYLDKWHTYVVLHVATILGFRRVTIRLPARPLETGSPPTVQEAVEMLVTAAEWYLYEPPAAIPEEIAEGEEALYASDHDERGGDEGAEHRAAKRPRLSENARSRRAAVAFAAKLSAAEAKQTFLSDFRKEAAFMMKAMFDQKGAILEAGEVLYDGYEQFWNANKNEFPRAFKLYRMFLSAPATSISGESLFNSSISRAFLDMRWSLTGQIALVNAWSRTPPALQNGRKGIIWPVRGEAMDPGRRIAELADAFLREEEVDADESDAALAVAEAITLGLDHDAVDPDSGDEYLPSASARAAEEALPNPTVRRGLCSNTREWEMAAFENGGQVPRNTQSRRRVK